LGVAADDKLADQLARVAREALFFDDASSARALTSRPPIVYRGSANSWR
jgi:hypothetical protein